MIESQEPLLRRRFAELQLMGIARERNDFGLEPVDNLWILEREPTAPLSIVSSAALRIANHHPEEERLACCL
jgi:hypothetical protein